MPMTRNLAYPIDCPRQIGRAEFISDNLARKDLHPHHVGETILRGEIYSARLGPAVGNEFSGEMPVLIVQNNTGNKHSPIVIAAPIVQYQHKTSKTHVEISLNGQPAVVQAECVRDLDKSRLLKRICRLPVSTMRKVNQALAFEFGLMPEPAASLQHCEGKSGRHKKGIARGDIYFAKIDNGIGSEQRGWRPVLVVHSTTGLGQSPTILVAPLTTKKKAALPTHVEVFINRIPNTILLECVRSIDRSRLMEKVTVLGTDKLLEVDEALSVSLDLTRLF